jgi:ribonuclease P protein component
VQRLKTRPQFQAVLAGGMIAKTPHFALHRCALDAGPALSGAAPKIAALFTAQAMWIGAMAPKRWAKRAVTRNAIKRQIYAVSAEFADRYPQAAFVVRLRSAFARAEFVSAESDELRQAVRAEVQALMLAGAKVP